MAPPPLVSVVIPVFNGARYLGEAIGSALAQDHPRFEVIVVDDGSDDGGATAEVAASFGGRIRYVRQENGGVASALNRGLREMRGEYFSWLSHDDAYLPGKLSRQSSEMERLGPGVVLFSDYEGVDADGRPAGGFRWRDVPPECFRRALVADAPVNGCTVLVSRADLEQAGGFDERLRTTQDTDLWFRLAARRRFVHVPVPLLRSRVHPGQGTRSMAARCASEGESLHLRLLGTLAAEEGGRRSFEAFLLYAAVRLEQRGYPGAARAAYAMHGERARAAGGIRGFSREGRALLVRALDRRPFRRFVAERLRECAYSS